jgi:hypothetical protein
VPVSTIDKMASTIKEKATESAGKQAYESFENKSKATLRYGPAEEQAGLKVSITRSNEEPLDVKALPNP